jgi:hypothetical protein
MSKRSGLADSPFFKSPVNSDTPIAQPAGQSPIPVPGVPSVRGVLDVRDEPPGLPVPPVRPAKRIRRRHPFDIYEDQLERLKELKTRAMRRGEEASMSQMVREALDAYLDKNA